MRDLDDRVAVITGAASGIGLGIARTFARAGIKVALLDRQREKLDVAVADIRALGVSAIGIETDVSDAKSVEAAAARVETEFGHIDIACNNAGVLVFDKAVEEITLAEWDWIIGVNIYGVIHGINAFLPRIRKHGRGGHIVNTASIGGFQVGANMRTAAYATTKFAVVALSEGLRNDLAGTNIGASILGPAAVATGIYRSPQQMPERFGGPQPGPDHTPDVIRAGMQPDQVGRRVLDAIRNDDFYIFTHMETREWLIARHQKIIDGFNATQRWEATEETPVPRLNL